MHIYLCVQNGDNHFFFINPCCEICLFKCNINCVVTGDSKIFPIVGEIWIAQ